MKKFAKALKKLTLKAELVTVRAPNGWGRAYVRLEGKRRWWRVTDEGASRVGYDPVRVHGPKVGRGGWTLTWATVEKLASFGLLPGEHFAAFRGQFLELNGTKAEVKEDDPVLTRLRTMVERAANELTDMASQLSDDPGAEGRARALVSARQLRSEVQGIERLLGGQEVNASLS